MICIGENSPDNEITNVSVTKDVLQELCEDDYSDAEEELEPNVDTD